MSLDPAVTMDEVVYAWRASGAVHDAWPLQAVDGPATVRTRLTVGDVATDGVAAIHLVSLIAEDGAAPFELAWERDTSLWGLGWKLQLRYTAEGGARTERTLSRPTPRRGHTYETMAAYDPVTGYVSFSVTDTVDGTVLHRGGIAVTPVAGPYRFTAGYRLSDAQVATPVSVDGLEITPHFLPVGTTWSLGELTESGSLLPVWRFDLDRAVTVALQTGGRGPGTFRLVYDRTGERIELASDLASLPGGRLTVPVGRLPLGEGTLVLEYAAGDKVWLSEAKGISIGELHVQIGKLEAAEGAWRTSAVVQSAAPIDGIPLRIDVTLTRWDWDAEAKRYEKATVSVRTLYEGVTAVTPAGTVVPLAVPWPEEPGQWQIAFSVTSPVSVILSTAASRMYATPPTSRPVRVCTYNMLGFKGWPEAAAAQSIGRMSYGERLAYFADVLRELDCDILGVQEGLSVSWLLDLAETVGVGVTTFHTPTSFPGAVFTDYPVLAKRDFTVGLRSSEVPFSRTAGAVLLDIEGTPVWVVNIHAHPNREELRQAEALVLAAELDELLKVSENVIVLGDFNSPIGTPIHNALTARGFLNAIELAGGGVTHTMTNLQGDGTLAIDHIYVSPPLIGRVQASRVVSDPGFRLPKSPPPDLWVHSDHLPVTAVLEF